jgi:hypothetical protein
MRIWFFILLSPLVYFLFAGLGNIAAKDIRVAYFTGFIFLLAFWAIYFL